MKLLGKICIGFGLLFSAAQADEALTRQVHEQFIDDYIVVHLQSFKVEAQALDTAVTDACAKDDAPQWQTVKTNFASAVTAWMPLQSMRFDAFEKNSRDLRTYFWPNSRGEKQAGKFLHKMDMSKLEPSYFHNLSVALQGLPIIEWLLYHKDSTLFAGDQKLKTYTCNYLAAVTLNLTVITDELLVEFGNGGAARTILLTPSDGNALYGALPEVTLQFYKAVHAMVEMVHGQKLSRPIANELQYLKPKRLEMWRAGLTKVNMTANIASIFDAYKIFSPMIVAAERGAEIDVAIQQQFADTLQLMNAMPDDFYNALNGDDRPAMWQQSQALIDQLAVLKNTLAIKGTEALGIPLGFNALDGD